jgi:predicted HTH transcriptional regulator
MSDLWNELKARGVEAIEDLCSNEVSESQLLEFKSKRDLATPRLDSDDKKNLGKTLSAFSNAVGGVLIFGVAPARNGEEVLAGKPDPIAQVNSFTDRVHGLIGQLITPPNPDVELFPIPLADGSGFLAIRVGASDARPHMSVATDHGRRQQPTLPLELNRNGVGPMPITEHTPS